ncbi:putative cytochrome P450 superfamily protein isoform X4 [Iris pallida]|uniref:Cytochrome P450 superfamily protein isoform X4 n=1 Tax=Iris pallida TaxID=29817 RepID=A0AAX6G3M2_IRIPA|nr:putative cytochrome P450 superfamily protein isoform X4 [Iris pallida]KAJ6823067.1 putative cytochrome P450 superfamily protein isoform X4 [Iris pallida]
MHPRSRADAAPSFPEQRRSTSRSYRRHRSSKAAASGLLPWPPGPSFFPLRPDPPRQAPPPEPPPTRSTTDTAA